MAVTLCRVTWAVAAPHIMVPAWFLPSPVHLHHICMRGVSSSLCPAGHEVPVLPPVPAVCRGCCVLAPQHQVQEVGGSQPCTHAFQAAGAGGAGLAGNGRGPAGLCGWRSWSSPWPQAPGLSRHSLGLSWLQEQRSQNREEEEAAAKHCHTWWAGRDGPSSGKVEVGQRGPRMWAGTVGCTMEHVYGQCAMPAFSLGGAYVCMTGLWSHPGLAGFLGRGT